MRLRARAQGERSAGAFSDNEQMRRHRKFPCADLRRSDSQSDLSTGRTGEPDLRKSPSHRELTGLDECLHTSHELVSYGAIDQAVIERQGEDTHRADGDEVAFLRLHNHG